MTSPESLREKLEEIAAVCALAAAEIEAGGIEDAIATIDETLEFNGNTLETVQTSLNALLS